MICPPCTHDCNEGRNCSAEKGNNMTQEASMIEKIKVILKGIDQEECESAEGWWETSTGAEFGAEALKQILELLAQTQEPVCPDCKAKVLYECVACSSNNYPPQRTEQLKACVYCGQLVAKEKNNGV